MIIDEELGKEVFFFIVFGKQFGRFVKNLYIFLFSYLILVIYINESIFVCNDENLERICILSNSLINLVYSILGNIIQLLKDIYSYTLYNDILFDRLYI